MNGPGPADFVALAKYALELVERVRSLGDDHKTLKARAGVLSLVFSQLHDALLKFTNMPDKYEEVFTDLRISCHTTLRQIEPTLQRLEKLKSNSGWKKGAKKVLYALQNKMDKLNGELCDQTVILSLMVLRINQMFDNVSRQREFTDLITKVDKLTAEIASYRLEYSKSNGRVFELDAIEQISEQLQQLAPRELTFDIRDTFGEFISHHQLMQQPFTRARPAPSLSSEANTRSNIDRDGGYYRSPTPPSTISGGESQRFTWNQVSDDDDNTGQEEGYRAHGYKDSSAADSDASAGNGYIQQTQQQSGSGVPSDTEAENSRNSYTHPNRYAGMSNGRGKRARRRERRMQESASSGPTTSTAWIAAASVPVLSAAAWLGMKYMGG